MGTDLGGHGGRRKEERCKGERREGVCVTTAAYRFERAKEERGEYVVEQKDSTTTHKRDRNAGAIYARKDRRHKRIHGAASCGCVMWIVNS